MGDRSEHWLGYPVLPNPILPYPLPYPTLGVKVEGRGEVGGRSEHWLGYPTLPYRTVPYPTKFKCAIQLFKK